MTSLIWVLVALSAATNTARARGRWKMTQLRFLPGTKFVPRIVSVSPTPSLSGRTLTILGADAASPPAVAASTIALAHSAIATSTWRERDMRIEAASDVSSGPPDECFSLRGRRQVGDPLAGPQRWAGGRAARPAAHGAGGDVRTRGDGGRHAKSDRLSERAVGACRRVACRNSTDDQAIWGDAIARSQGRTG